MKWATVWIRVACGTTVVAVALAGCGKSPKSDDQGASAGLGAAPRTTSTAASSTPSASPAPVLPDGRSAVYLTGVNATKNTVSFDLIEFLTGNAAKAEWKKQHPENPDGPDNDYMIVNNNKKLRTLPVAADAKCVVLSTLGGTDTKTIGFVALPAFLEQHNKGMELTPPQISILPFWLTVKDGTVTKFEEQFLP
jgi:hypothetical protein